MTYEEFVQNKRRRVGHGGFACEIDHLWLFPFQRHVVQWALSKGRACGFIGTGLGKTRMELACAKEAAERCGRGVILAPLAVAGQTLQEAHRVGIEASKDLDGGPIVVMNYDRLHQLEWQPSWVILDESSILKSHDGAYRQELTDRFRDVPIKMAFTATPAPNDYMELGTHAEFVGASTRTEMLAEYFTHDGGDTSKWRLKRHARRDFWQWVSQWAICFQHPRDIGYPMTGYDLPELVIHDHIVGGMSRWGGLFGGMDDGVSATSIRSVQRESLDDRIDKAVDLANSEASPIILWCSTNEEHDALMKAIPRAVGVRGSDTAAHKEWALLAFADGAFKVLVTKPSIAGFGMNWQHCHRMVFVSISYSYEMTYQAIRRCWRFGQTQPVHVHMVYSDAEESVNAALGTKSAAHSSMLDEMRKFTPLVSA